MQYWLAPSARGWGIATMAVVLRCRWAFQSLGLDRITLKTLRGNLRSQRVAERAGFRLVVGKPEREPDAQYFSLLKKSVE